MIPHELRFHGIRDYEPTIIDLSGIREHVLIAGPNGSGKSTITFCMGAVLNSGKVNVEGLKSRNIQEDETWHASIHFLFKNEGDSRIDAPYFIEFSVQIEQEPYSPMKRIFTISSGNEIASLQSEASFRSGGQPNFSDYRRRLMYKYKVYPDDFYLIWYQQEVNQFAVMSPEERFRVFSEMHGITNIQKNWETSLEQVREMATSVEEAKNAVQNDRYIMLSAKDAYERLLDYKETTETNGQIMIQSLLRLIDLHKKDYHTLNGVLEQLSINRDNETAVLQDCQEKQMFENDKLVNINEEKKKIEERLDRLQIGINQNKKLNMDLKETIHALEDELKEIEEKSKRLLYSEEETRARFAKKESEQKALNEQLNQLIKKVEKLDEEHIELLIEKAQLEAEITNHQAQDKEYADILQQYKSKHIVNERITVLETKRANKDMLITNFHRDINDAQAELTALNKNNVVSKRQQEALVRMRKKHIKAYPLRSLVELEEDASLEAEKKLDTIKYTIFYNERKFAPVNDLYYVSLMQIVPKNFIDHLPELQLRIRKDLTDEEKNYAVKVLWWIKLFFQEDNPFIEDGQLIDDRGVRGPQESETYILSQKALEIRKRELHKYITFTKEQLEKVSSKKKQNTADLQELHSIIRRVAEAEAFQLKKQQHQLNIETLRLTKQKLDDLSQEKKELTNKTIELRKIEARMEIELEDLCNDLKIYEQLGEQKHQFEKLKRVKRERDKNETILHRLNEESDELEIKINKLEKRETDYRRKIITLKQQIEDTEQELVAIKRQEDMNQEQKEVLQQSIFTKEEELLEIEQLEPALYKEVTSSDPVEEDSEIRLNAKLSKARTEFKLKHQQTNINFEAANIYKKVKENYEQKEAELDELVFLLAEHKERAEQNEQDLIATIQTKVLRIDQLFHSYMTHFQFECDIDFDKYEEKNGRVIFRLFIKVRKQGHSGKMEDVSLKARTGRVGQGVSGGEESLSSLLFALSLLQELDIRPSFIVLDEFDSALDEGVKTKVFNLYAKELERKLIIISPKGHENKYLNHFGKAYVARHDPTTLKSILAGVRKSLVEETEKVV